MTEQFRRLCHCLHAMETVHAITSALRDDFNKRGVGRMFFIRLGDFLKTVPELKNQFRRAGHEVADLEKYIRKLKREYQTHFSGIRHHLTAHRDDLDLIARVQLWTEINWTALSILSDDARTIVRACQEKIGAVVTSYDSPQEIRSGVLESQIRDAGNVESTPTIGMDSLAYARANTLSIVPCHESQERGLQIVSCFDLAERELGLLYKIDRASCPEAWRVLIALIVLDTVNLLDQLVGVPGRKPRHKTFRQMASEGGFGGYPVLERAIQDLDPAAVEELMDLRNKACAHLDRSTPIANVLQMLDGERPAVLHENLQWLSIIFGKVCMSDIRTRIYLTHRQPLEGALAVQPSGLQKPFHNPTDDEN